MTETECEKWRAGYFAAFPDTRAWFSNLLSPADTFTVWVNVLQDVDFEAATEVTLRLARGDIEPIPAYDREKTAAIVRREAKKIHFTIRMPKFDGREPRYQCPICLDAGSVTVWASRCVQEVRKTQKPPQRRYVEACACKCPRGASLATEKREGQQKWKATARYDEAVFCRVVAALPGTDDIERLLEWVGVNPEGPARHTEFDEWNADA